MSKKPKARKGGSAVAKKGPGQQVAVHKPAEPVTFIQFLDKASRDPDFSVEKFKVIMEAKEREDIRAREQAYDEAMAACQKDMAPIRADMASDKPKNKYASAVKLDNAIRPIYSRYGFSVSFDTDECPQPLTVRVVAYVACAGHKKRHFIDIPADGKGPSGGDVMSRTHAVGSAMTYGRGILLRAIFNLVVDKGSDDDGHAAGRKATNFGASQDHGASTTITDEQLKTFQTRLASSGLTVSRVLKYASEIAGYDVPTPSEIRAKDFPAILQAFDEYKPKK